MILDDINIQELIIKAAVLIATTCFAVEITPIKINPISWFFKRVYNNVNRDRDDKLDSLEKKVDGYKTETDKIIALMRRANIIRFAESVKARTVPETQFLLIFDDIKAYNKYCDEHKDFPNNCVENEIEFINKRYKEFFKRTIL